MNETFSQVDLTTCDREPIHVIGRIQSFGYLVSFSSDWIINHVSANCGELFGVETDDLIGIPAAQLLSPSALHDIRSRLQLLGGDDAVERLFGVDVRDDGTEYDIAVHMSGRNFIAEFEPSETGRRRDYASYVRPMIDRMRQQDSVEMLCKSAARHLRGLTGFDRVMVYRFAPDGAGEVVAESINGSIDSFQGLHFPASDIPAQARRLYARNLLRIISDVDDPTVPIVPQANPDGQPLDLTMSTLRAVSPIHIEYLKNMGVKASMSVSIMRRGQLWGLMACHHYSPLRLSYALRTASELFGEFFAYVLEQRENDFASESRGQTTRVHDEIMSRLSGGGSLIDTFDSFADSIAKVISFDGIVGWVDGEFIARGDTPDREQFARLARFLNTAGASTIWATDNISSVYPAAQEFADQAVGLLALPVSRTPRDYIVLFRREHVTSVNWAGNPNKPVELGPNGARLTPRKSFDLWKEERNGYCRPWKANEIASADSLRVTLLEVMLRMSDAVHEARTEAAKRQDILIAELNHRVRNILNLIRGLVRQSRENSKTIDEFAEIVGSRIYALARAHDQVTETNWSPSSFYKLIQTECEAYADRSAQRVRLSGPDAMIAPEGFTTLALVVHELLTNSCKYGALSDSSGTVEINVSRTEAGALQIVWAETGGPRVEPPKRRGFGSTIIERTIPHELGGTAQVDYHPEGLKGHFTIPPEYVASYNTPTPTETPDPEANPDLPEGNDDDMFGGHALVVEDNVIIALEAEEMLVEVGFASCVVTGSVGTAIDAIERNTISFAMLDINLGNKSSEPVAQVLADKGIPFVFASGYGDKAEIGERFKNIPIIAKPYSRRDVEAALKRLRRV